MSSGPEVDKSAMPKPGERIAGRYVVERSLGCGGMGFVVAAKDEQTGEAIALKLLHNVSDTRAIERFFREARAMGRIASEHVVRVRDVGNADDKSPFLVMDRLEGIDLAQRAKQGGPLPLAEAADYLLQACEALSHAHSKGIVHRDVKPSNLFLHRDGEKTTLKVLDFGISKIQTRDVWERTLTATADGGVLGSPPYMSPEQVRDPRSVDSRTDVWSLGIVLYRLLAGVVPYDGESVGEVFAKILERPAPSLRVTTAVPEAVDAIIARCLAKDRDERFLNVGELALALAPFAPPEAAALAPGIAARMREEGPTLDRKSVPSDLPPEPAPRAKDEPRTMTVSRPPPAPAATSPSSPPMAVTSVTPPPLASGSDSVSLDVEPQRRGRPWIAIALAAAGIAGGIAIGVSVRGGAGSTAPKPTASTSAAAPSTSSEAPATSVVASATGAPASATATATVSAPTAPPPTTGGKRVGGKRPTSPTAATPATAAPPATTSRPELQPSPYPTAQ